MDVKKLSVIIEESTKAYVGVAVPSIPNHERVDMVFMDVLVDIPTARKHANDLKDILMKYPQPEILAEGPSYIEIAHNAQIEKEPAIRLMALGKILGFWKIIYPTALGADGAEARQMADLGFLMISGYNQFSRRRAP